MPLERTRKQRTTPRENCRRQSGAKFDWRGPHDGKGTAHARTLLLNEEWLRRLALRYSCESAYGAARIRTADMEHEDLRPLVMNQLRRLCGLSPPPSAYFKKMELYTRTPSTLDKLDW
ncbi:hypothetical protein MRX96_039225 [Rhipicephalus microplus]